MIETDYVWMKPLQAPKASDPKAPPLAFPFTYINPQYPTIEGVMRKMYPASKGAISDIPGTGPAPVMMRLAEWIKVRAPTGLLGVPCVGHTVEGFGAAGETGQKGDRKIPSNSSV